MLQPIAMPLLVLLATPGSKPHMPGRMDRIAELETDQFTLTVLLTDPDQAPATRPCIASTSCDVTSRRSARSPQWLPPEGRRSCPAAELRRPARSDPVAHSREDAAGACRGRPEARALSSRQRRLGSLLSPMRCWPKV